MLKTQNRRCANRRFAVFFCSVLAAIVLTLDLALGQTAIDKIGIERGLLNNYVTCVFQDSKGFIWIGTKEGASRFDGVDFLHFTHNPADVNSLSGSHVLDIAEDSFGGIWIGTDGGLSQLNTDQDRFTSHVLDDSSPKGNMITRIFTDKDGSLWVGNGAGSLFLFEPKNRSFLKFPTQGMAEVRDIVEDPQGRLLIAYGAWVLRNKRGGVKIFDKASQTYTDLAVQDGSADLSVTKVLLRDNSLYLGTYHRGVFRLAMDSGQLRQIHAEAKATPELVYHLALRTDGEILIGTDGDGIFSLKSGSDRMTPYPENKELSSQAVTYLMEDDSGLTWAGTVNGGINVLDPRKTEFEHWTYTQDPKNGLSGRSVLSLTASQKGGIWIGLDHGGLNYYDPETQGFEYFDVKGNSPADEVINGLLETRGGNLLLGYYQQGMEVFDPKNGRFEHHPEDEWLSQDSYVKTFFEDEDGTVWVGTRNQGLIYHNPRTGAKGKYMHDPAVANSLPHNHVTQILDRNAHQLWIGTFNGFSLLDKRTGELTNYTHSDSDSNSFIGTRVYSLCQDQKGNLWIASDKGLEYYDAGKGTFAHYNVSHGLPSNTIKGVVMDGNQDLWIASNRGISKLSTATGKIVNYGYDDGINGIEFNENSLAIDRDGKLYFGGVYGVTAFHPGELKANTYSPPVYITGISLHNQLLKSYQQEGVLSKPAIETQEIQLKHFQSDISFDFVALNYTSAEKNSYAYYLEGYEKDWNYVGNVRSAKYTNLAPGDYTFFVKASNNDGVWNEVPTKISIRIHSPWWKTWWAYCLYFFTIALSVFGLSRASLNRLRLLNDLKMERMEKQNQEKLYRMKMDLFTNISHEFRTPLSLIVGPIENLISSYRLDQTGNSHLRIVHQSAGRLKKLADQLLDFRKSEEGGLTLISQKADIVAFVSERIDQFGYLAKQNQISICRDFDIASFEVDFDLDKLDIVLYNLLSNAFKFTKSGGKITVGLKIMTAGNSLEITVKDNGIGIREEDQTKVFDAYYQSNHNKPGTGIGLSISKAYVELHGGKLHLRSKAGVGSTFTVQLPIRIGMGTAASDRSQLAQSTRELKYYDRGTVAVYGVKYKVLIIEDDLQMQAFLEQTLAEKFFVKTANNGLEGKLMAETWQPDLVLSDVMMPELDGLSLCRVLKENFSTSHIPILLLSAKTSEDTIRESYGRGVDDYLVKPFSPSVLVARIENIISGRERLKRLFSEPHPEEQERIGLSDLDSAFLDSANQIIEKHRSNPEFDINSLVKELGMSRSQVFRKIKAITGQSPHQFLLTSKLNEAARLLARSGLNVSEVAYELGFGSVRNFRIAFKKQFDASPTDYVRKIK